MIMFDELITMSLEIGYTRVGKLITTAVNTIREAKPDAPAMLDTG